MLRKVAIGMVVLVAPPLTLAQAVAEVGEHYWYKAAIVAFTWTLGVAVGTVLSSDIKSEDEHDEQD